MARIVTNDHARFKRKSDPIEALSQLFHAEACITAYGGTEKRPDVPCSTLTNDIKCDSKIIREAIESNRVIYFGLNFPATSGRKQHHFLGGTFHLIGVDIDPPENVDSVDPVALRKEIFPLVLQGKLLLPRAILSSGRGCWIIWKLVPTQITQHSEKIYARIHADLVFVLKQNLPADKFKVDEHKAHGNPNVICKLPGSRHPETSRIVQLMPLFNCQFGMDKFLEIAPSSFDIAKMKRDLRATRKTKYHPKRSQGRDRTWVMRARVIRFLIREGHLIYEGGRHEFLRMCCFAFLFGEGLHGDNLHSAICDIYESSIVTPFKYIRELDDCINTFLIREAEWFRNRDKESQRGDSPRISNEVFYAALGMSKEQTLVLREKFPFKSIRGKRTFSKWMREYFALKSIPDRLACANRKQRSAIITKLITKYFDSTARETKNSLLNDFGIELSIDRVRKIRQEIARARQQGMKQAV